MTEELLEEAETAARVREAISTLPPGQSEAVRLFYLDSLSEAEVAAELGIARSAVKSRLDKARRSLSGHLREERRAPMAQSSLVDVDVVDVRREPAFAPGAARTHLVVLGEHGGTRALPIFIGEPEGRAMAASLTGLQSPRPMTYQMTASLVAALSGSVTEVRVMRLSENTFIAEVVVDGPSGPKVIDARPSDAINLALLTGAPVRASSELLEQLAPTYEQFAPDAYPDDATSSEPNWDPSLFARPWSGSLRMPWRFSSRLAKRPTVVATLRLVPATFSWRYCEAAGPRGSRASVCLSRPPRVTFARSTRRSVCPAKPRSASYATFLPGPVTTAITRSTPSLQRLPSPIFSLGTPSGPAATSTRRTADLIGAYITTIG